MSPHPTCDAGRGRGGRRRRLPASPFASQPPPGTDAQQLTLQRAEQYLFHSHTSQRNILSASGIAPLHRSHLELAERIGGHG